MPPNFLSAMQSSQRMANSDTIIRAVLAVWIAVLPFKSLLIVQRNGFILLLVLLVGWCIVNQRFFYSRTPYDMLLLAFVVWVGFTIPFAVNPLYSLKEYGRLLQHMVVFYAVIYFFKGLHSRQVFLGLIGIIAGLAAYALSQFNFKNPLVVSFLVIEEVWLTTFLVMVLPFALALVLGDGPPVARSGGTIAAGMILVCLILTQSRAGMVALLGEVLVIAWFLRSAPSKIFAMLVTVGLIAMFTLSLNGDGTQESAYIANILPGVKSSGSVFHRFEIWAFALSEIAKHWLVGIGYGSLSYLFLYGQGDELVMPGGYGHVNAGTHNILLYLGLHVGLPGLLLFGWFIVRFMLTTAEAYRCAQEWMPKGILLGAIGSVVGLMLRLQFDQMLVGSLAAFFWVILALTVSNCPPCHEHAKDSYARESGVTVKV